MTPDFDKPFWKVLGWVIQTVLMLLFQVASTVPILHGIYWLHVWDTTQNNYHLAMGLSLVFSQLFVFGMLYLFVKVAEDEN